MFSILDETKTPMGARLLKRWISRPLKKVEQINKRLDAVNELFQFKNQRNKIVQLLSSISDVERLLSKVATLKANPRDLISLKNSITAISEIKRKLVEFKSATLSGIAVRLVDIPDLAAKNFNRNK